MKPKKKDKKYINKIFTLDIETRSINNIRTPICISNYNGIKSNSFYISDYEDSDRMILFAIRSLLKSTNNNAKIYVHNLSNFDGVFLLRILSDIENTKITPVIKDGKIINLNLSWTSNNENVKKRYSIDFRDSLLLLPISLRKLAKAFDVEFKGF
jgi:DNA polymerase type B, organellar and viral